MEAPFEEFLNEIEDLEITGNGDQVDDFVSDASTGGEINGEDEEKSVLRFRSMENSPPSLTSLSIFKICSWINELTCKPSNNKRVQEFYDNGVKQLPGDIQAKIRTQLSMTSLRCIYQHLVWDLDPHILAAGIKQEEDMLRYLYWKQPTNPLLKHFEKTLVIKLLEDNRAISLTSNTRIKVANELRHSLLQNYLPTCFDYKFVSHQEFINNFTKLTNGCLKKLNWNNVIVVGGSVLKSAKRATPATKPQNGYADAMNDFNTDIDIYVHGLTPDQAQMKAEEVYNSIQSCWPHKIGIFKTNKTITLVSNREFRNVQIILSTYASPLEVLLASDLGSCSIGFNGQSVLTTPRFLFGTIYGSNVLDSSLKFETKLQSSRLVKYYNRGYNLIAPLYLRVHGHGSLNSEEKITSHVHPTTFQLLEVMKLVKVVLLQVTQESPGYYYSLASTEWYRGMHISFRTMPYRQSEEENLQRIMPNPPDWVQKYYEKYQKLSWVKPGKGRFPPPPMRYAEDYRTLDELQWSENPDQHYNPLKTSDIRKYVTEQCKFDPYSESVLQSFHLNFFVDKQQTAVNPYREMNTSLVRVVYRIETIQLTFSSFNKFLKGEIKNMSKTFRMHNANWKLSLSWGSKEVSFITLTKEHDEHDNDAFNHDNYQPKKFFANFLIKIKNNKVHKPSVNGSDSSPKHLFFDGSQVFTYRRPDNMWLTYARNCYFKGYLPHMDYDHNFEGVERLARNEDMQYIEKNGDTHWEVLMQLVEPHFNVVSM